MYICQTLAKLAPINTPSGYLSKNWKNTKTTIPVSILGIHYAPFFPPRDIQTKFLTGRKITLEALATCV